VLTNNVIYRSLVDVALGVLASVAARKYPHMDPGEALEQLLVEQAHYAYYDLDRERDKAAEGTWKI